jgi:outer membrane protein TolC
MVESKLPFAAAGWLLFLAACASVPEGATTARTPLPSQPSPLRRQVEETLPASVTEPGEYDLQGLLDLVDRSPALTSAMEDIAREIGTVVQGSLAPNPVLRLETDMMPTDDMGFGNARNKVFLRQRFETAGKADARVQAAATRKEEAEAFYFKKRGQLMAEVAKNYYQAIYTGQKIASAARIVTLKRQLLEQGRALNAQGRISNMDLIDFEVEVEKSAAEQKTYEAEERKILRGLEGALGLHAGTLLGCRGEGDLSWTPPDPEKAWEELLGCNPDLILLDRKLATAEAELHVQGSLAYPDFTLGAGYIRGAEMTSDREDFVAAFVEIPLQLVDRNQGGKAASEASIRKAGADLEEAAYRLIDDWHSLSERLEIIASQRDLYHDKIIPLLEIDLSLQDIQVSAGRQSIQHRLQSAVKLEESLMKVITLDESLAAMRIEMQYLTGGILY